MRSHLSLLVLLFIVACAPAAEEPVGEASTTEADVEAIQKTLAELETNLQDAYKLIKEDDEADLILGEKAKVKKIKVDG